MGRITLEASFRPFIDTNRFCVLLLCLLPLLAYVPVAAFSLSLNPINFGSGLVSSLRRGVTFGGPWLDLTRVSQSRRSEGFRLTIGCMESYRGGTHIPASGFSSRRTIRAGLMPGPGYLDST